MKYFLPIFFIFLLLGCGSDDSVSTPPPPPTVTQPVAPSGAIELPLLVIQVEFLDVVFNSPTLTWYEKMFGSANGQLNHYFSEVSQDNLFLTPVNETDYTANDGFIKVRVNQNHIYTLGTNFSNYNAFINVLQEAIALADPYVNFANYDTNANGQLDVSELQIMFLFAGGEEATGVKPGIWAHSTCLNPGTQVDNTTIMECGNGSFTAFGERHFDINGPDASIGIIAHELGHGIFFHPDLYDIDGSSEGIGNFGLMGAGSWGHKDGEYPGTTPVHMSAWTKIKSGFIIPEILSVNTNNYELFATHLETYKPLRLNTQEPNEYFLIENRSALGYDAGLYTLDDVTTAFEGGLAIWHIDESKTDNSDDSNRLVDLEEADALYLDNPGDQGNQSNLFYSDNNNFTPLSSPSDSSLYNNSDSNISITNVSIPGSSMFIDITF